MRIIGNFFHCLWESILALSVGIGQCMNDAELRSKAFAQWKIGVAVYVSFFLTTWAFGFHTWLTGMVTSATHGLLYFLASIVRLDGVLDWFGSHLPNLAWYVWEWFAWLLATALIFITGSAVGMGATIVASGPYQSAIATTILRRERIILPTGEGMVIDTARSLGNEAAKQVVLLPATVICMMLSFIGLFPITLPLSAWLLGFSFVDVPLDVLGKKAGERLQFARDHKFPVAVYGGLLLFFWSIPFLGLLIAPAATAGATRYIVNLELINTKRAVAPTTSALARA